MTLLRGVPEETTIVNIRRTRVFDVFIGRGSRWGNPYRVSRSMPRARAIALYELELHGKVLGCFCVPLDCHGFIVAKYAARAYRAVHGIA